ncbi:thymidylate synthase [Patescibacteria group bacterium]|nr:thymidylate synthase [Patescibacteria group bacterium]
MSDYIRYEEERIPDRQYNGALKQTLDSSYLVANTAQGIEARMYPGVHMSFDLANGIPLITERDMTTTAMSKLGGGPFWQQAIGEILAILNGANTHEAFMKFGCYWWAPWAAKEECDKNNLPEGVLGEDGFYGPVLRSFKGANGTVDQIERLIRRLTTPGAMYRRTNLVTSWDPSTVETASFGHTMSCVPCHGTFQVTRCRDVHIEGQDVLHFHLKQRSGDLPVGIPQNMFQYAVLHLMLAKLTGCRAGIFSVTIADCHIYNTADGLTFKHVNEMISRVPYPFPKVLINTDFALKIEDFRVEHFDLVDYKHHPKIFFKVAV